ncbi:hypothetical protein HPB50_009169 [Hyalomma asiaticum]|uniref:Uncharacterized protein n=1 Tax=Hyalomma asiaticum TaxID=266040 RepID=A0ACB7SWL9_HYAAI|nr:hypothetical protein HPB50_009169 [Hyalomma asiaticum]
MAPHIPLEERRRIVELSLQGWSQRAICGLMNRSRTAVSRIIKAYRDRGGALDDEQRCGRPRATDSVTDQLIVACAVVDPFLDANEIRRELQLDVSSSTIRRRLWEAGLQGCVAAQKPQLTERQRQLRLEFARAVQDWAEDEWREFAYAMEARAGCSAAGDSWDFNLSDEDFLTSSDSDGNQGATSEKRARRDDADFIKGQVSSSTLPPDAKKVEYFKLFFDEGLVSNILAETNKHAKKTPKRRLPRKSRLLLWPNTDRVEMYCFLAVVFLTGIVRKYVLRDYWPKNIMFLPVNPFAQPLLRAPASAALQFPH